MALTFDFGELNFAYFRLPRVAFLRHDGTKTFAVLVSVKLKCQVTSEKESVTAAL